MSTIFKVGLDIHGVTDTNPFFKEMARLMVMEGHEVHIITGASTRRAIKDLKRLEMKDGEHYTHIHSITDHLISNGVPVEWKDPSNPMFPDKEWDIEKAKYCCQNQITIHFDDSLHYGTDFVTPFAHYKQ